MATKLKEWIKAYTVRLLSFPTEKLTMPFVVAIILLFLFIVFLYLSAWIWVWITNTPDLPELRQFLVVIIGGATITFATTFGRLLIDKNNNGIPDKLEGEDEK